MDQNLYPGIILVAIILAMILILFLTAVIEATIEIVFEDHAKIKPRSKRPSWIQSKNEDSKLDVTQAPNIDSQRTGLL